MKYRGFSFTSLAVAGTLLLAGCMGDSADGQEPDEVAVEQGEEVVEEAADGADVSAVNVRVMTLQPESFDDVVNVVGTVKPAEDIMIASEEGGKVERWFVAKGAWVGRGQNLLRMNDDMLQAQLQNALAQEKIARLNAERNAQVYADAGAVSEVTVTTAQYNLEAAEAQVKLLKTRIAKMTVKAPVSGRIEERITEIGEMVGPGAPIARLIQTGVVKVTAGVPERYVSGLRVGTPVTMVFDALGGRRVTGRITYVASVIDPGDRTLPVEIEISNPGNSYKSEMVAEIEILRSRLRNSIVVPRTALVRVEGGYQVYVAVPAADGGWVAEARDVVIGPSDRGVVVITDGLKAGEQVIVVGQNKVNPGEHVEFDEA